MQAKRGRAVLHWLTNTIGGGLSLSNWPFMCISKAYSSVDVLTSKAISACLLRKRKSKQLQTLEYWFESTFWVGGGGFLLFWGLFCQNSPFNAVVMLQRTVFERNAFQAAHICNDMTRSL